MTITMHRTARRASEGTLSARQINRAPLTPDPYLLDTQPQRKAPPKLRLIKHAEPGPACGFGSCSVTPECTGACRYRQADEALRSHYGRLHSQRQDMPPMPLVPGNPPAADHSGRRGVWALLIAWCIGALGIAAWVAWDAVRALLTV